ncbi:MAG: hypothetical protein LKF79_02345 [Solobacterium sp.]|jgi:hypothetical protein|nr:hypothetical protein [Solobacterium sp.]MCH4222512.1 hypothetical protein [Solobacterium sp.]MCH4265467.1 hypothetical protein [Solobacterium sp.]
MVSRGTKEFNKKQNDLQDRLHENYRYDKWTVICAILLVVIGILLWFLIFQPR